MLKEIQQTLFAKALRFRDEHITAVDSFEEFKEVLEDKGGFIAAHWDGTAATKKPLNKRQKPPFVVYLILRKRSWGAVFLQGINQPKEYSLPRPIKLNA